MRLIKRSVWLVLLACCLVGCSSTTRKVNLIQAEEAELTYTTTGDKDKRGLVTNNQAGQVVWVEFGAAESLKIEGDGKELASLTPSELGLKGEGSSAVVVAYPRQAPYVLTDIRGLYESDQPVEPQSLEIPVVHDFRQGGSFELDPSFQIQSPIYAVPKEIFRPEDEQNRPYYRVVKVPEELESEEMQEYLRQELTSKME